MSPAEKAKPITKTQSQKDAENFMARYEARKVAYAHLPKPRN